MLGNALAPTTGLVMAPENEGGTTGASATESANRAVVRGQRRQCGRRRGAWRRRTRKPRHRAAARPAARRAGPERPRQGRNRGFQPPCRRRRRTGRRFSGQLAA